jgi:ribonuclease BN (tRNA processing enzyme)
VRQLALYHHEPERNDDGIEALAVLARKIHPGAFAAREGMQIDL